MKGKILVVEDDLNIAIGLEEVLRQEGYRAVICKRGDKAVEAIERESPALLILDVMLPGLDGFEICRQARLRGFTGPVLMLTAKGQELDKVIGFKSGADDYVTKPFGIRELTARIEALLRRCRTGMKEQGAKSERFAFGAAEVDPRTFELIRDGKAESLTARELKLLEVFAEHPKEVLSRERLLNEVWGYDYFGTTRTLDQVIVQLRKKLGEKAEDPKHLRTVHGVGYRFEP